MNVLGMLRKLIPNLFRWGLISRWLIALCLWAISIQLIYPVLIPWPILGFLNTFVVGLCIIVLMVRLAERFFPGKPIWLFAKPFLHVADVIALAYLVCGVGVYLNGALEVAPAQTQYAEVLAVAEEPVRLGSLWPAGYVKFGFQDADSSQQYLFVDETRLKGLLPGTIVNMWVYNGGFGIPWVQMKSVSSNDTAIVATLVSKGIEDSWIRKQSIGNDLSENRLKQALEKAPRYFEQQPGDFYFAAQLADRVLRAGDPAQAVKMMEPFVEKHQSYKLYCLFGGILGLNGDTRKGMDYLKAAIAIDPKSTEAYYVLGYAYKNHGDKEEARRVFTRLAQIEPYYSSLLNGL